MAPTPPPAPPEFNPEEDENGVPLSFIQFTFVRPDSWEFQLAVGPQTSFYQMAAAVAHLETIVSAGIGTVMHDNARQAQNKHIIVPGRPLQ